MAYKIPWSNFHELNLDWLLQQVKELRTDVDGLIGSATPSDAAPAMDGAGTPGTAVMYSRGDHQHPTDTSRAAASDLTQEITDRGNADITLQTNIDAVDAKIKFNAAAPLMDSSSASAGFSDYMARADHVHPTDTSRASATDLATLSARVDAFAGSANPSDATPLMDGIASAGTVGAYSRGDHRHPADTSKLDTTGGTITGNLTVKGTFTAEDSVAFVQTDASGWLRAIQAPNVQGTYIEIEIVRKGATTPGEVHKIVFSNNSTPYFQDEVSKSDLLYVDKIRYSDGGYIDIHMDQTYQADIGVKIKAIAPTKQDADNIKTRQTITFVADAPSGETIMTTYNFAADTNGDVTSACSITKYTGSLLTLESVYRDGKVIHIQITAASSSNTSEGSNLATGSIIGPAAPAAKVLCAAYYGEKIAILSIAPNRDIVVRLVKGSVDSTNTFTFGFTYICE